MGYGMRTYLVEDGFITPITTTAYLKMRREKDGCGLAGYEGRKIRLAHCWLKLEERKPVALVGMEFPVCQLDKDGFLDEDYELSQLLAADDRLLDLDDKTSYNGPELCWTPPKEVKAALAQMALNSSKAKRPVLQVS